MNGYTNLTGDLLQFNQNFPFQQKGNLICNFDGNIVILDQSFQDYLERMKRRESTSGSTQSSQKSRVTFNEGLYFETLTSQLSYYFPDWTVKFTVESTTKGELWPKSRSPIFQLMTSNKIVLYEIGIKSVSDETEVGNPQYNCFYRYTFDLETKIENVEIIDKYKTSDNGETNVYSGSLSFQHTFSRNDFPSGDIMVYSPIGTTYIEDFLISTTHSYTGPLYAFRNFSDGGEGGKPGFVVKEEGGNSLRNIGIMPPPKALDINRYTFAFNISFSIVDNTIEYSENLLNIKFYYDGDTWYGEKFIFYMATIPRNNALGNIIIKVPADKPYYYMKSNLMNLKIVDTKIPSDKLACVFPSIYNKNNILHYPTNIFTEIIRNKFYFKIIENNIKTIDISEQCLKFPEIISEGNIKFNYSSETIVIKNNTFTIKYIDHIVGLYDPTYREYALIQLNPIKFKSSLLIFNYLTSGVDLKKYKINYDTDKVKLFNPLNVTEQDVSTLNYFKTAKIAKSILTIGNIIQSNIFKVNIQNINMPLDDYDDIRKKKLIELLNKYKMTKSPLYRNEEILQSFTYCNNQFIYGRYDILNFKNIKIHDPLYEYRNMYLRFAQEVSLYNTVILKYDGDEELTESIISNLSDQSSDKLLLNENNLNNDLINSESYDEEKTEKIKRVIWYDPLSNYLAQIEKLWSKNDKLNSISKNSYNNAKNLFKFYQDYPNINVFNISYFNPVTVFNPENIEDISDFSFNKINFSDNAVIRYNSDSDKQSLVKNPYLQEIKTNIIEDEILQTVLDILPAVKYLDNLLINNIDDKSKFRYYFELSSLLVFAFKNKNFTVVDPDKSPYIYLRFPQNIIEINENSFIYIKYNENGIVSNIAKMIIKNPKAIPGNTNKVIVNKDPEHTAMLGKKINIVISSDTYRQLYLEYKDSTLREIIYEYTDLNPYKADTVYKHIIEICYRFDTAITIEFKFNVGRNIQNTLQSKFDTFCRCNLVEEPEFNGELGSNPLPPSINPSLGPNYNDSFDFNISLFNYNEEIISYKKLDKSDNINQVPVIPKTINQLIIPIQTIANMDIDFENDVFNYNNYKQKPIEEVSEDTLPIRPDSVDQLIIPIQTIANMNIDFENDVFNYNNYKQEPIEEVSENTLPIRPDSTDQLMIPVQVIANMDIDFKNDVFNYNNYKQKPIENTSEDIILVRPATANQATSPLKDMEGNTNIDANAIFDYCVDTDGVYQPDE